MKRFGIVGLVVALFAGTALAYTYRSFTETQILTAAAPSTATDGMSLAGVEGFQLTVSAPTGQTLSGGTMRCYILNGITTRWARCDSTMDVTLATGVRDYTTPSKRVSVGAGRLKYIANSVTLSGAGTTVSVSLEARVK